jgi:hypothetical protein
MVEDHVSFRPLAARSLPSEAGLLRAPAEAGIEQTAAPMATAVALLLVILLAWLALHVLKWVRKAL